MNRQTFNIYQLTDQREKNLWSECVFIFDTSALLDLYFYPETTRQEIYNDILEKIKDRLWLPNHVQFEYLKNREGLIRKPIVENYTPLIDTLLKPISDSINQTQRNLQNLKQRTKNKDKHPFIDSSQIEEFEKHLELYSEKFKEFDAKYKAQIVEKENEILELEKNDTILETIEKYFPVGREYSFDEIIEISKEGKHRYEFDIPPGYEDLKKEKKEGTQIFGDLIIWKQILEYAKENKKSIIFVCNDLKKDWCILEKSTEKRVKSPREELIKEFKDFTGKDFWMYNQAQFIFTSNKLLKSQIADNQIEQISHFITAKTLDNFLVYQCDNCFKTHKVDTDYFDLDYELVYCSERQMGGESHYEANYEFECPTCDNKIMGSFNIWEYPVGAINYTEIDLDGAQVIKECVLHIDLDEKPDDYDDNDLNLKSYKKNKI